MSPDDPDRQKAYEKFLDLFYRINEHENFERLEVPFAGGFLHGLNLAGSPPVRGTVVIHAGFDAFIEEFFGLGKAFATCGYDAVMFDGPGQGSTLMRHRISMTHAWEQPVAAVLDHLDLNDVTLLGISLGGYLALRAAAFEPRIKRVIADDVMLDFFACVTSRRGKAAELLLRALVSLRLSGVLDFFA